MSIDLDLDLDAIRARQSGIWAGSYPVTAGWPASAAIDIRNLVAEVERLRAHVDLTEAAIAYVDATEGTDEVEQCWHELRAAVDHYRAVAASREEAAK